MVEEIFKSKSGAEEYVLRHLFFCTCVLSLMAMFFRELRRIVGKLNGMTESAQKKSDKEKGYSEDDFKS